MYESRDITCLFSEIVRARIVLRKTVVGDRRFEYLSSSHLQSQVKSRREMMVFMPLVLVWIGQFCRDVIGRQNVKVVVIGRLSFCYKKIQYTLLNLSIFSGENGQKAKILEVRAV